ncbi:metalloregulator ArsR/SmtB family transcription factor [Luteimonas sp. SX5]|uniref:Metalloregulator ArsR/SmtB family transcription factor n=1 Tax=Luteimonas galliterrae TaxID=2940486 RepID=A0ABT0MHA2_9GAMM|nr:metalloregulator ArsR/SmtB family transcription factor [Luteimonas galliterrae]MCL1634261.1 metalloregulator ArsR/SmtB family transcription factor [Luteimonas galliterrae]
METDTALSALRALGQEHRLAAFRALVAAGPDGMSVGELRERVDVPAATLSAHLNTLRSAGLVADTREGRVIRVRAHYPHMNDLLDYLTENCCGGAPCVPAKKASRANTVATNAR